MNEIIATQFDYSAIECTDADREFLKGKESSIKSRTAQTIIENGLDLLEAKARVGHGHFLKWVEGCFPWSRTTAFGMMTVAENFKCLPGEHLENFHAKALYLLSAPSTPEPARQAAIEKAEAGETVTHADAKALVEAHRKIADLEKSIKQLQNQLPTKEVLAQITRLQADLDAEKKKPPTVPADYDKLKTDKLNLEIRIRDLKDRQEKAIRDGVASALGSHDKEIAHKQKQLESINGSIEQLMESMKRLDKEHGVAKAYGDARDIIRKSLYAIAIAAQDAFEEGPIPENYIAEYRGFIKDMRDGALAIETQIGG